MEQAQEDIPLHLNPARRERVSSHCVCCASTAIKKSPAVLMPFVAHRVFGWAPVEIDESWGLNTILKGNAYTICNTVCCDECGFLFLDIRFSDTEMEALYKGYRDEAYISLRERYEPGYRKRNDMLMAGGGYVSHKESFLRPLLDGPSRILDWGGDSGKNTPFKADNKCLHIYDLSSQPVIDGARQVARDEIMAGSYDLIISSHVLEHVPYPVDLLQQMRAVMTESTLLYLEIPLEDIVRLDSDEPQYRLKKRHWHEHINFFTERALRALVKSCELEVVAFDTMNVDADGKSAWMFQMACRLAPGEPA